MELLKEKIFAICKIVESKGSEVTKDNVITYIAFSQDILMENPVKIEQFVNLYNAEKFIRIGFCQPKYYKPSTWRKAQKVMNSLCSLNIGVKAFDFGRGKGKYTCINSLQVPELAKIYVTNF